MKCIHDRFVQMHYVVNPVRIFASITLVVGAGGSVTNFSGSTKTPMAKIYKHGIYKDTHGKDLPSSTKTPMIGIYK